MQEKGKSTSPAQTKFNKSIPAYNIEKLRTLSTMISMAGNTIEAFVTAPIYYDYLDMDFVNAIFWYRDTEKYVEWTEKTGGTLNV